MAMHTNLGSQKTSWEDVPVHEIMLEGTEEQVSGEAVLTLKSLNCAWQSWGK